LNPQRVKAKAKLSDFRRLGSLANRIAVFQPVASRCDSRLRCRRQLGRLTGAPWRVQRVVKRQPLSMIALVAPHSGLHWGRRSCGRGRIGFARARDQRESEDRKCRKKNDQARTFHRFHDGFIDGFALLRLFLDLYDLVGAGFVFDRCLRRSG
jgi:hypothetical protein